MLDKFQSVLDTMYGVIEKVVEFFGKLKELFAGLQADAE